MSFSTGERSESGKCGQDIWLTAGDGSRHYLRYWPADRAQALVFYLHGIEGHSLWFQDTALFLQQNGVTTLALDRRGAGMSREARGDMKNWQQLLSDTVEAFYFAKKQAGDRPLFLMGNCWGARLAALLAQAQRAESKLLSGFILSSPAIDVKVDLSFGEKWQVLLRFIFADRTPLSIPLTVQDFTENPPYLTFIENDQLRLTEATAQFFVNTALLSYLTGQSPEKICVPTLILQAGADRIVQVGSVRKWFARIAASDKTFQLFEHSQHSLDFDAARREYWQVLSGWINEHSNPPAVNAG